MIRAVLFDLGNVILPVEGNRLAKKLMNHTNLSEDSILNKLLDELIINDFEKGHIDGAAFYSRVREHLNLQNLDYEEFTHLFNDIFTENPAVIELIAQLKKEYKLGMISNTNPLHIEYLTKKYPLFDAFDTLVFSHDVGSRKPDPHIYNTTLQKMNTPANEAVFIDDLPVNVQGAENVGIKAIHFQNFDQLKQDLTYVGVAV